MLEMYNRTKIESDGLIAILAFSFLEGCIRKKAQGPRGTRLPSVFVSSGVFQAQSAPESAVLAPNYLRVFTEVP